ncbi:hypothetical protein O181_056582 [Austropuccinia psidii MF-1]|uniref:Uncharacterized protein n=1 Tax=Austropuccinia psidii MF-1 TaxID=1389203 RepID=A0A9Q3HUK7_9BASI|nr:hypothetical protein [Austropuccinia psidii MF-1]
MLAAKHTRNACLFSDPSDHTARGVPNQDALARTPLWSTMMKAFLSGNGRRDPKQEDGNNSGKLAQSPQVLICPPPLLGHHPMVTSLLDWREVIIQLMKDGNGKRTFELVAIITMSCHPWDSNAKENQPNPPQQDSPVPSFPSEQTLPQLTPGPSGTQWLEDLFNEPSQRDGPPIPGPSASFEPHEDIPTHDPEPEVAPTQSMEEPFACPTPPHSIITIDNMPGASSLPSTFKNPTASSPHSHDEDCQEFTNLQPTLIIPQAISHESINPILLENC